MPLPRTATTHTPSPPVSSVSAIAITGISTIPMTTGAAIHDRSELLIPAVSEGNSRSVTTDLAQRTFRGIDGSGATACSLRDVRMPAEWEPHERTVMGWPCRRELWGERIGQARADYAAVANAIAAFEPVTMIANAGTDA